MPNELDLGPIDARLNAATPGPWRDSLERARLGIEYPTENINYWLPVEALPENAEFIANARMDIPALIAEIHRLRALVATQQATVAEQGTKLVALDSLFGTVATWVDDAETEGKPISAGQNLIASYLEICDALGREP